MVNSRHFILVVIGDNPNELIKKYDKNLKMEPYILYEFKRAHEYHEQYTQNYQTVYDNTPDDNPQKEVLKETLNHLKEIDDTEFYIELTDGRELDEKTGDLIVTDNPGGRYDTAILGTEETVWPLVTKDGKEVFTALKGDVDWDVIHLNKEKVKVYERTWEMVMEGSEPQDENEKTVFENMKNRKTYFKFWGTKEDYVKSQCSFWGFAVVDQNGWRELEDDIPQVIWINNFYNNYIKELPDNTRITIYDCYRK